MLTGLSIVRQAFLLKEEVLGWEPRSQSGGEVLEMGETLIFTCDDASTFSSWRAQQVEAEDWIYYMGTWLIASHSLWRPLLGPPHSGLLDTQSHLWVTWQSRGNLGLMT